MTKEIGKTGESTSRRRMLLGSAAFAAGTLAMTGSGGASAGEGHGAASAGEGDNDSESSKSASMITMPDGTQIYYKDWGARQGRPVVFSHGWPLSSDAFEDQMMFLGSKGFRCIGVDRRGHGRSSQPWDGNTMDQYADDLAVVVRTLNLTGASFVGHSTGGGEVARYIGRHGTGRVAKAVLVAAVTPLMLQTSSNPGGLAISVFDGIRSAVQADRAQFWLDLAIPFFGTNRPGTKYSQGRVDTFQLLGLQCGLRGAYECIKQFSETDFSQDLRKMTIPTLVIHGDDDQIVPIGAAALAAVKLLPNPTLKVYAGGCHGLPQVFKDRLNADLLEFLS